MNPPTICANLRRAGLLDVAERAAKRAGMRLADCLVLGAVHPGHVSVWGALARAGKTPAEIAALVCRQEDEIARALKPGTKKALAASPALQAQSTARLPPELRMLVEQAIEQATASLRADIAALQRTLRPVAVIATNGRFDADAWLFARGVHGIAVRSITEQYGVSPAVLLSRQRSKHVTVARRAAVAYLTEQGMSTPEIGRFLRRDHTTILETLRAIGMRPAGIKCGQRKAAA